MPEIELRDATLEDAEFLFALHAAALGPHVERIWGWDELSQRLRFVEQFDPAKRRVVMQDGERVGAIGYRVGTNAVELDYVALLPAHQGRGLGTALVERVVAEAERAGLPVRLRVLRGSAARSLYERLGFEVTGHDEHRYYMQRRPLGSDPRAER